MPNTLRKQPINISEFKKRNSAMLMFSIFSSQLSTAVVIYGFNLLSNYFLTWIVFYYFFTFFAAIPQCGYSDVYGRKKHLLISSTCILFSSIYLLTMYLLKKNSVDLSSFSSSIFTTLPICVLLGVLGNAIPIARAGIADLRVHDFRTAIGWSTIFIGFGWITAILLGFIMSPFGVIITSALIHLISILITRFLFVDQEDMNINPKNAPKNTIMDSYRWLGSMVLMAGGAAAILAYLFTESSFYIVYSSKEEGVYNTAMQTTGIVMAFGYAFGVIIQWIISLSDKMGIKFGVLFSAISLLLLVVVEYMAPRNMSAYIKNNFFLVGGVLNFLFSFGFGFFVPSLFSLMASKLKPHYFGRLFGTIDTTDTLALSISSLILYLYGKFKFSNLLTGILVLCLFFVSLIFYMLFLKRFSNYEKTSKTRDINFKK